MDQLPQLRNNLLHRGPLSWVILPTPYDERPHIFADCGWFVKARMTVIHNFTEATTRGVVVRWEGESSGIDLVWMNIKSWFQRGVKWPTVKILQAKEYTSIAVVCWTLTAVSEGNNSSRDLNIQCVETASWSTALSDAWRLSKSRPTSVMWARKSSEIRMLFCGEA